MVYLGQTHEEKMALFVTYHLEAYYCSPLAMQTGWQSCNCTPRGCPQASLPAGRATDSMPPPLG